MGRVVSHDELDAFMAMNALIFLAVSGLSIMMIFRFIRL